MAAKPGLGSVFKYYDGADSNPVTVVGVKSIQPPTLETQMVESTELSSTTVKRIATLRSVGPVVVKFFYDSDEVSHGDVSGLRYLAKNKTERKFAIVLSDTGADDIAFRGVISKFEIGEVNPGSLIEATVEITVNGDITVT